MPSKNKKRIPAVFYRSTGGAEPVRDWLKRLSGADRRAIGVDIATVEYGWPVGMPTCRTMGGGLFEVRSSLSQGRIARILFCIHENFMVLLHGFIKKAQKTPDAELALALKRKKEIER